VTLALKIHTSNCMETRSHGLFAMVAWIAGLLQFLAAHYNMVLSVACGLGALVASIVSIYVGLLKAKKLRFEISQENKS